MRQRAFDFGIPIASGVLLALCFPSPHLYFLAWVALAPLVYVTALAPCGRRSAWQWFLAGWVFHAVLLQWLIANVMWVGGWAFLGYLLMVTALAVFWGLLGAGWSLLLRRAPRLGAPLFAGLFIAVEWIHANLFGGFGWSAVAYSQGPDAWLLQLAAIGGTALVALPVLYANAAIGLFFARVPWRFAHAGIALLLAIAGHAAGAMMLGKPDLQSQPLRAGIFQSNFPNQMKWDGEYTMDMVKRAVDQSKRLEEYEPVDLMVWPEALVMYDFNHPQLFELMKGYAVDADTALFTGTEHFAENRSFNSSILIAKNGSLAGYYDKVHLVPFGEYVPYADWLPLVQQVVNSSVAAGIEQKVLEADGVRVGPLICFEVLYPHMAAKLRAMDARVITVITNLAWFGQTSAIEQELEVARVRAVETRLPLLHASNTGISGMIDPWGRFQSVDSWATFDGRLSQREGVTEPLAFAHRRALGAFDVPAPAKQPLPGGPVYMPIAIIGITALMAGFVCLPKRTPRPAPQRAAAPVKGQDLYPPPDDDISI